ncbi:hypothetical protein [Mesorhizobium sp. CAU 1741]|uniref:hypothetical protein n=1 Tax=Mesorhizobium sp. CAU 1741 TaxID=3140366 RepID=UPI00325B3586
MVRPDDALIDTTDAVLVDAPPRAVFKMLGHVANLGIVDYPVSLEGGFEEAFEDAQ